MTKQMNIFDKLSFSVDDIEHLKQSIKKGLSRYTNTEDEIEKTRQCIEHCDQLIEETEQLIEELQEKLKQPSPSKKHTAVSADLN